ncbi:hypothetical protein COR50_15645 [Chitinophaga caeni]|uniref:Uncharacterized protein n=1 Tax=Chitinophaga caeni TaxID=2029983 RepID=A0A291QWS4_9BACT|nr:hypothetical protein COR50_15645 [Chitinophaga caeni]
MIYLAPPTKPWNFALLIAKPYRVVLKLDRAIKLAAVMVNMCPFLNIYDNVPGENRSAYPLLKPYRVLAKWVGVLQNSGFGIIFRYSPTRQVVGGTSEVGIQQGKI